MIYVLEVRSGPNGLQADMPEQVHGPDDLDHVSNLDGFESETAEVDFDGVRAVVPVYRRGEVAYVRLEDCPRPDDGDASEID